MISFSRRIAFLCLIFGALAAAALFAQVAPPLVANGSSVPNWTVVPYHRSGAEGGLRTMTDISPGVAFVAMQPCRVFDTRNAVGAYGGPRLVANVPRDFDIDSGPCSQIPPGVDAYSMNFAAIFPDSQNSFVTIWPTGSAQPLVSSINPIQGGVVANAAIVPAGSGGSISVVASTGLHLVGDINGYFTADFDNGTGNHLQVFVNSDQYAILGGNNSATCAGTCGISMYTLSGTAIEGNAAALTGETYGVLGVSQSDDAFAAGVRGITSSAGANAGYFTNSGAGVSGVNVYLATQELGVAYSVYSAHRLLGGSLVITGSPKSFAAPHPDDAGLEIRYASVEAPTVDVYFRGTGELRNGVARIEVPDHFRHTALEGTYMTTLTPVGRAIPISVESEGSGGIVVRGSGNTRFHYVVYAERAETIGFQPVMKNETFTPEALAKGGRLESLPEPTRALLIRNGTLNPDGRTFNLGTARAQGWTVPPARTEPVTQPVPQPSP